MPPPQEIREHLLRKGVSAAVFKISDSDLHCQGSILCPFPIPQVHVHTYVLFRKIIKCYPYDRTAIKIMLAYMLAVLSFRVVSPS